MITLHHLEFSRSIRVLWLLEELGIPFEIVRYRRDDNHRSIESLKAIHPLGKSPIIVDGDLVLTESGAILRYLDRRYGNGRFSPPAGTREAALHDGWLDYVESSASLPIMMKVLAIAMGEMSEALTGFVAAELRSNLDYIRSGIGDGSFIMGAQLTLADMQMSVTLSLLNRFGLLDGYPEISAYLSRLKAQPGLIRAARYDGPMSPML